MVRLFLYLKPNFCKNNIVLFAVRRKGGESNVVIGEWMSFLYVT